MLAAVPQAVLAVDVAERIAFVNAAAATLLGDTVEGIGGRSLHQALETVTADGGRACALCLHPGDADPHEGDAVAIVDGARIAVRFTASPILDRGERVGTVLTLQPPPTADELERQVRERIGAEMQAMLADLAHELNNPLTVILAGAGMMREHPSDDVTRRRAELLSEAAERCVGIVRTFRSAVVGSRSEDSSAPRTTAAVTAPVRPTRAQILVVDDEPLVANAMAAALAAEGHEVDIAGDGISALARIATRRYDVILTDVRMPRLDGPGLYHELGRVRPELVSRVVFVTGDTLSPATRRFLETAGAPSVKKPFEPRQLRTAVRRLLSGEDRDIA